MSGGKRCRKNRYSWVLPVVIAAVIIAVIALILPKMNTPEAETQSPDITLAPEDPTETPISQEKDPSEQQTIPQSKPSEEEEPIAEVVLPVEPDESESTSNAEDDLIVSTLTAEQIMAEMSQYEKVCQLFIAQPSALTGVATVTAAGETTQKALEKYPVGGILYNKSNMKTKDQVVAMVNNSQSYSKIPLLITCDEEGGRVNRLMSTVGTTWVGPMLDYKDQGTETAFLNAKTIAMDLKSCGFNLDLAPVADVWSNPANTVIGDRAYSDDFEQASELVAAAVQGFREGGVGCTLKHFPGHGDTSKDSHYGSVYVYKTLEQLRQEEFLPFRSGIAAGADAVMMGHMIITDVEDQPALFSYELVTEILRKELGFQGVVMTDALEMKALSDHYGIGDICVNSILAGVDLMLCPNDLETAIQAVNRAVEQGVISQERLDESVLRILTLKENIGLL